MIPPRRDFLRQLVTLPLIGGAVAIVGRPIGVAEPITRPMLVQYANWLYYERRIFCHELEREEDVLSCLNDPTARLHHMF